MQLQTESQSILAKLPNELVIDILRLAAEASQETCLSLSLVSSWTRDLALPSPFATVVIKDDGRARRFIHYLSTHYDHAAFIRNLWLPSPGGWIHDLKAILRSCHRLVNLGVEGETLWHADHDAFDFSHFQAQGLRLLVHDEGFDVFREATFLLGNGVRPQLVFHWVTHIFTYDLLFLEPDDIGSSFTIFPQLTHLAIASFEAGHLQPLEYYHGALTSPTLTALVLVIESQSCPHIKAIRELYGALCERKAGHLEVYVAFGGSRIIWQELRQGWLDEVEGRGFDIWEKAIGDTEEWKKNTG
jgi:hypothetical protein